MLLMLGLFFVGAGLAFFAFNGLLITSLEVYFGLLFILGGGFIGMGAWVLLTGR